MRILVTGSSGFLGRQVAEQLASTPDNEVLGFDLAPSSSDIYTRIGDLRDPDAVADACNGVDVVAHFGGIGDVDLAHTDPALATSANVLGTLNVGRAAAHVGARLVYASTWEVYGEPGTELIDEHHRCDPAHVYGASKLAGEVMLRALQQSELLRVAVLRLGTAYGPGMRPNTVFRRFADRARAGSPINVQGTGEQSRQFTHTSDVARAVHLAATVDLPAWTVFNIVADEVVTIRLLAELVAERYGAPISFGPARAGDPPSAHLVSDEARRLLGWTAERPFHQGLDELLGRWDEESAEKPAG